MQELPKLVDFTDKEFLVRNYVSQMERRCQNLFEWKNLPETIDPVWLEQLLQREGCATLVYVKQSEIRQEPENMSRYIPEGYYVFGSGVGGVVDFNNLGTFTVVANARLNESLNKKIGEDCVICYNDSNHIGLLPLHLKYATQLTENDLTLSIADIATRALSISVVGTDTEKKAFEDYMQKLKDGKMSAIVGNLVMDSIQIQPYAQGAHQQLTDLIEVKQYLTASWMIELGMNSNFNMKREAIMSGEADLNEDSLMTLVEDMLRMRKKFCEQANELFGLNIDVEYGRIFNNNVSAEEVLENGGEASDSEDASVDSDTESVIESDNSESIDDSVSENKKQESAGAEKTTKTSEEETVEEKADIEINIITDNVTIEDGETISIEEAVQEEEEKEESENEADRDSSEQEE